MWNRFKKKLRLAYSRYVRNELPSISQYHVHPTALLYNKENIQLDPSCLVCEYVIVRAPAATLKVGKHSQLGPFSVFFTGDNGISIGNDVMISPHCVFAAGNHEHRRIDIPMMQAGSVSKGPIVIDDDVWIGANCTITDNVRIGKGAVVAANSVVNKNVEPYDIVGGVPASKISSRLNNA